MLRELHAQIFNSLQITLSVRLQTTKTVKLRIRTERIINTNNRCLLFVINLNNKRNHTVRDVTVSTSKHVSLQTRLVTITSNNHRALIGTLTCTIRNSISGITVERRKRCNNFSNIASSNVNKVSHHRLRIIFRKQTRKNLVDVTATNLAHISPTLITFRRIASQIAYTSRDFLNCSCH